jgi:enoyl-CoA hydratase/carnithine racemase
MAIRPSFDNYKDAFEFIKLERDADGILLVQLHTNGGEVMWNLKAHEELAYLWGEVARDMENRVVILTGSGDTFCAREALSAAAMADLKESHRRYQTSRRLQFNNLDVEVPMIAAVNGDALIHSEQALMCDIVLSVEDAIWADLPHYPSGRVPGDGVHVVWPAVIGLNRARYMMLTGQRLTAAQMMEYGGVNEILSKDELMPRAYALARLLLEAPDLVVRSTRHVLTQTLRRQQFDALNVGILAQHKAYADRGPDK